MRKIIVDLKGEARRFRKPFVPSDGEKLEHYGLYYGIYRGIIREYDKKEGLISVEIPSLDLFLSFSIYYFYNFAFPFVSGDAGVYFDPQEGDAVFIAFENANINYPIILGYFRPLGKHKEVFNTGEHGRRVLHFKTRSGHELNITDEQGKETVEFANFNKSVKIVIKDKKVIIKIQDTEICADENKVEVKGKEIKLHNDGSIEPMVLGDKLKSFLEELLKDLATHTHAPNSPPNQAMKFMNRIPKLKDLLSQINKLQ